jgi:glutathione S-transferase
LKDVGYEPEVTLTYGLGLLPGVLNDLSPGRREVKRLTGNHWVPVLVLDDGEVIQGSRKIADWATANPPAPPSVGAANG